MKTLTKTTKGSVLLLTMILMYAFMGFAIVDNFLESEEVIVLANENPVEFEPIATATPTPEVTENEEAEEIIRDLFGDEADVAIAIAKAESGLNPDRIHSDDVEHSVGLFQINLGSKDNIHYDKVPGKTREEKTEWLQDPYNNVLIAKFIHGSSGWWPWTVFKTGAYKKFLE